MISRAVKFLRDQMSPLVIYLFGSRAKGQARAESDLDLAVIGATVFDKERLFRIQLDLAALLDHPVDLVDLRAADTVLQMQVLGEGQVMFSTDDNDRLAIEAMIMKDYQMLNYSREPLILAKYGEKIWMSLSEKIESICRRLARIDDVYQGQDDNLSDITRQDAIVLNLQRACEQAIDLANLLIARCKLETPKSSRQAFEILATHALIDGSMAEGLKKMVGFRNIAVHDYQKIDVHILKGIITKDLPLFRRFAERILTVLPTTAL